MVRIPLGDGTVGWGRQLRSVRVEFYDRFDAETDAEQVDPQEVARCGVAFTVAVMDRAFRRNGGWTLLDVVPLSEKEEAEVYRSFKQYRNGALSIYWEKPEAVARTGAVAEQDAEYLDGARDPPHDDGLPIRPDPSTSGGVDLNGHHTDAPGTDALATGRSHRSDASLRPPRGLSCRSGPVTPHRGVRWR